MPRLLRRALPLALLAFFATAPTLRAQQLSGAQVLRSWVDEVKLDDGSTTNWTFTLTYDAEAGLYARTVTDAAGAVVERVESPWSMTSPSPDEVERARTIILNDPELQQIFAAASDPIISGGFELVREEGHPCGPGSRCLQFDMINREAPRQVRRLRYVVVNLRDGTVVSNDFNPETEGNLTRYNRDLR